MLSKCHPWDNLKFNLDRSDWSANDASLGTLQNTYNFFPLRFKCQSGCVCLWFDKGGTWKADRASISGIVSKLRLWCRWSRSPHGPIDATKATRAIMDFTVDQLSQLVCATRQKTISWRGDMNADKQAAYRDTYGVCWAVAVDVFFCAILFGFGYFKTLTELVIRRLSQFNLTDWKNDQNAAWSQRAGRKHGPWPTRSLRCSYIHSKEGRKWKCVQPLQRNPEIPVSSAKLRHSSARGKSSIGTVNIKTIEYSMMLQGFWWKV